MLHGHTPLHWLNLVVHVLFGAAALLLGAVAILSVKGRQLHRRAGRMFLYAYAMVIGTAVLGLLAFDFRSFLAVVTIMSLYDAFAGYRALRLRGRRPQLVDRVASVVGMCTPWIFIAVIRRLHQPWSPVLTWSILGGLLLWSGYDLLRNVLPVAWLRKVWVQEHLLKMMGAYIAISSAAAGTIFPGAMPWAAIVPSVAGTMVGLGVVLVGPRAWRHAQEPQ